MEIRIIVPGVDCKITDTFLGHQIANDILERMFFQRSNDVMSIHKTEGDIIAEITIKEGLISICRSGKFELYTLAEAEDIISNTISQLLDKR